MYFTNLHDQTSLLPKEIEGQSTASRTPDTKQLLVGGLLFAIIIAD